MFNEVMLQFAGFYGGSIGNLLSFWEQAGFFSYALPFLLIFALVFGILMRTQIFKDNRGINVVISLVVGLLALQFDFVPIFFSQIFPRIGVALSVILAFLIIVGLFLDPNSKIHNWMLFGIGVIVFLVVIFQTLGFTGFSSGYWWYAYWPSVVGALIFIILIAAIVNSNKKTDIPELRGFWAQPPGK
jgi:hypothetical protein